MGRTFHWPCYRTVLIRSVKTSGGLTRGRGMTEQQRATWLYSPCRLVLRSTGQCWNWLVLILVQIIKIKSFKQIVYSKGHDRHKYNSMYAWVSLTIFIWPFFEKHNVRGEKNSLPWLGNLCFQQEASWSRSTVCQMERLFWFGLITSSYLIIPGY